jgi:hypothetical protein
MIMVGNKADLHEKREVEEDEGESKAAELGMSYC